MWFFALEIKCRRRQTGQRKRVRREGESRYGEVENEGRKRTGCCEPDAALKSAITVEGSSDSDSLGGISARRTYSRENVSTTVIEVKSLTTW